VDALCDLDSGLAEAGKRQPDAVFGQKKKGSRRERSAQFLGRWLLTTYFIALTRAPKRDL
jgi:hypothetical protein